MFYSNFIWQAKILITNWFLYSITRTSKLSVEINYYVMYEKTTMDWIIFIEQVNQTNINSKIVKQSYI